MRKSITVTRFWPRPPRACCSVTFRHSAPAFVGVALSSIARSSLPRAALDSAPLRPRSYSTSIPDDAMTVSRGIRVTLTYKAALEDGTVFDDGLEPITFVCGEAAMVPGFHTGILGMRAGETRDLLIEPADGFGERDETNVVGAPMSKMPDGCQVGSRLSLGKGQGEATIVAINGDTAAIDLNHPLAGKKVKFTVNLISCEEVPRHERIVVETSSPGDGVTYPKRGNKLTMHYTGSLAGSGAVFDSSRERGDPFTFTIGVKQVIDGWDEGIMQMSLGERAVLSIPAAKGYGAQGAGKAIPPNADLVFDVELLAIN